MARFPRGWPYQRDSIVYVFHMYSMSLMEGHPRHSQPRSLVEEEGPWEQGWWFSSGIQNSSSCVGKKLKIEIKVCQINKPWKYTGKKFVEHFYTPGSFKIQKCTNFHAETCMPVNLIQLFLGEYGVLPWTDVRFQKLGKFLKDLSTLLV